MINRDKIEARKAAFSGDIYKATPSNVEYDGVSFRCKFAAYGNVDSQGDMLIRGCFSSSIEEKNPANTEGAKIPFCWQHDIKDPIGVITEFSDKDDGCYCTVRLSDPEAVPNSKRAIAQFKDGLLNQFSIGFRYKWDRIEWVSDQSIEDGGFFLVKEVDLREVSVVTLAANTATSFEGFLSDGKAVKEYLMAHKDNAQRLASLLGALGYFPTKEHREAFFSKFV